MDQRRDDDPIRLDLVGLRCPLPVLKSRRALAGLAPGALLEVSTSDPLASLDLPNMCREDGHRLVSMETDGGRCRFLIECGGSPAQEKPPEKPEI